MKDLKEFITENNSEITIEDYLGDIVNSSKEKNPPIYDDTGSWEARDAFEYWQSAFGEWDDVIEFISDYADNTCVAGWCTKESFEETEKIIPQKLKDIMKNNKSDIPYKKRYNQMEVWETTDEGFDVTVMKFKNYANDNGTDYIEYWYMIAVE